MAWLGLIETDSILIKEKHKHLSKMADRVSKRCDRAQALEVWVEKVSWKYVLIIKEYSLWYKWLTFRQAEFLVVYNLSACTIEHHLLGSNAGKQPS